MLCYSACPVVANEPDFLGPAAIALGHRYNMDSRDEGQRERNEIFRGEGTVFSCSYANECSEVCPKHVDPAAAVNQAKFNAVIDWVTGFVLPRGGRQVAMARPAHPHAMQPARPGRTRTAPPQRPTGIPFQGRYLAYLLFDATGIVYLLVGFVALRVVWALGDGPEAWQALLRQLREPALHRLPRARARLRRASSRCASSGSSRSRSRRGSGRPSRRRRPVIHAMLYAAWIGVTLVFAAILGGGLF